MRIRRRGARRRRRRECLSSEIAQVVRRYLLITEHNRTDKISRLLAIIRSSASFAFILGSFSENQTRRFTEEPTAIIVCYLNRSEVVVQKEILKESRNVDDGPKFNVSGKF